MDYHPVKIKANNMKNLKDTLTTICGLIAAVSTSLIAIPQVTGTVQTIAVIAGAVSIAIIGYFNGKTSTGKKKSVYGIEQQKKLNS
jgi:hypothetical protein